MAAAQLISRGKRRTAAYLKAFLSSDSETSRLQGHQDLHNLLEHILSPERAIDDPENLEWLQWLVAGGDTPEDFAKIVRRHDNATTCGLVWTANFVAYRCRTCGISPCMSLCADCFQAGNHAGHDFNMFRSQAGGACDCGDTSVMKTSGFCHRHGPGRNMNVPPCPHDVLAVAEAIIPRILLRVVQHFRDHCRPGTDGYEADMDAVHDADSVLSYLHDLTRMGAAMRKVLTHFLTNPQTYKNFTYGSTPSDHKRQQYQQKSQENYQGALATIPAPPPPFSMEGIAALKGELVHQTFLEELMFWTLKYEFPQKMVTLLLQMLPDNDYKDAFTRTFVQHYSRISVVLVKASDADTMSNRVVHISVQLFSNEDLTRQMVETHQLLEIVLAALVHMMENIQIQSALHDPDHNFHMVVNCSSSTLKDHRYWPLVSDLINILSHRSTAAMFMSNSALLSMWAEFVSLFTGMNLNVRELEHHVEFEPNTYYAAFSAELEACASPMWTLVGHCKQKNTDHLCRAVIDSCLTTLQDWFDAICFQETPPPLQVSFHFPLHRHLAVFISQAVRNGAINIDTILGDPDFLIKLMAHPLQIQVALCEIHSGMWVRNGLQIKGQAMTYVQCHFCCSMIDLDLYLLQLCASRLDPDYFVRTVLERFSVDEFLSLAVVPSALPMNPEQELSMLQGALLLLCTLQSARTHLGLNERDLLRQEMVSQLCMSDRTHSQLMDLHPKMPERTTGSNQMKDFEATLKEVADFKAPNFEAGGMQQGTYTPKASVWEQEFDPIFILVRAVHRRDFQTAMDRYTTHMKQAGLVEGSESPWPPFRQLQKVLHTYQGVRKILNSKTLHGLIFCILWKALTLSQSLPEPIIYLCIYLLDMAVDPMCNKPSSTAKDDVADRVPDKRWEQWFPSSNILTNLRHEIQYITVPLPQQESMEDLEDIPEENEEDMDTASPSPSRLGFTLAPTVVRGGNVVVTRSREGQTRKSPDASTSSESRDQGSSSCEDTSGSEPMDTTSSSNELKMEVKQSILSMLVKLHDKLSKDSEHYQPPETWEDADLKWSRGARRHKARDGARVIGRLLDRIASTCQENLDKLKQLCCKTAPKKLQRRASDGGDREERRRKARDKQAKLLAEFAAKQRTFLESTSMEEDDSGEGASAESPEKEVVEEELYDCVICGQTDPSTPDRPIGRVVLLLASSVLGHRSSKDDPPRLPCSDGMTLDMLNCGNTYDLRQTVMQDNFQMSSCLQSVSVGWFGGVYVQSCGHFLHSDCHKSYIRSLRSPDYQHTTQNIDVDKGEFTCPLCRQLANSVLPCQPHQHPLQKVVLEKKRYGSHKKTTPAKEQIKSEQETDTAAKENDAAESENGAAAAPQLDNAEPAQEANQSATAAAQQLDDQEKAALAQKAAEEKKPEEKQKADQAQASTSQEPSQEDKSEDKKDDDATKDEKDKESGRVSPEFPRSIPTPWRQQAHVMKENQTLDPKPEFQRMIKDLGEVLKKATNADCEEDTILRQGVEAIMEDITKATYPKYKVFPKSSVDESLNVFVHSVARTNLELELVQCGNTIVNHSNSGRKFGFVDLLHVLRFHFNATGMDSLWTKLTTLYSDEEERRSCNTVRLHPELLMLVEKRETPMVLRDATSLLIQLTLSLPWPISKAHFTCIVRVLFTLLYTQSLVDISCRFSEEERRAWREAGTDKAASTECMMTESMLSCLISHLVHTPLYHDTDTDLQRVDISQSVWSPHSVEHHIQKYCIHSLRISALLRRHLFKEDLPDCQDPELEFQTLVKYLDLQHAPPPTRGDASAVRERPFTSASCLHWAVPATQMISHWCQDFTSFVNRKQGPAKSLLLKNFAWKLPCLLRPPSSYDSIFQYHRQRQCTMCCSVPKEPALCMVCGELLCMKGGCCRQQSVMECVQHSVSCGAGTGVFLVVNSSTIIVVRGPRACLWGSLYLDSHGEEDRDLRRGRPLYLSEDRFRVLTQQWISHSFDHMCKRWLWHHNRL
ncbi:PREDICTED: E3 ubiquitin-protein ligase UBR3-like isoform X5 [Branchiostoma belcheri]|uniref:E3 ubiquitin-protein ligase n=1 Tax=Branchiostoma belcheri TaxID=7741 RepID=A0A6P4ZQ32_BRABE|nr:PREDICTED: E3 ubiquitin-protein ligase UBR3-like isoform X5 [Branchiostoma belcheri]